MSTYTEQQTKVNAERSNVSASLAADPEDCQVAVIIELEQLGLVDSSDAQLSLDRGDEWWSLKEGTSQGLDGCRQLLDVCQAVMKAEYRNVLLSCSLLGLDEPGGSVDADD